MLCKDSLGWWIKPASLHHWPASLHHWTPMQHVHQHGTETWPVPRGSVLSPAEPAAFHSNLVTATMDVRSLPGVPGVRGMRATVSMKDLQEVPWPQGQLLKAVRSPETRYSLLSSLQLAARPGDAVQYCAPGDPPVPATVRFVGPVPELRALGHLLGLEAADPDWLGGDTDGSIGVNRYFNTDQLRGVFCDVSQVLMEDSHCSQRLESLKKSNVERIAALMDNNDVKNVNTNQQHRASQGVGALLRQLRDAKAGDLQPEDVGLLPSRSDTLTAAFLVFLSRSLQDSNCSIAVVGPDQDQRDNAALMAELQETKDKLYKLQWEGEVKAAELADRAESVNKENMVLQSFVKELTQKGQKIEAVYKEGVKRDDELRRATETFVSSLTDKYISSLTD
jgi:hypothetical protein